MSHMEMEASWKEVLSEELDKAYYKKLMGRLEAETAEGKVIYPPSALVFNAFNTTPIHKVKVVVLGQDPYHNPNQAMGLSFSVPKAERIPPSLRNIYKELATDIDFIIPTHGDLTSWAEQGVFLLNAMLTVEHKQASSHKKWGWQIFTDAVIRNLSEQRSHVVFILWGGFAQRKRSLIDESKHLVLTSVHPSPLSASRGFFGNQHFSRTNEYLVAHNKTPIDWTLS